MKEKDSEVKCDNILPLYSDGDISGSLMESVHHNKDGTVNVLHFEE